MESLHDVVNEYGDERFDLTRLCGSLQSRAYAEFATYPRTLLILGACSTLRTAAKRADRLARWAISVKQRRGYRRACVAVAAKNARIIWALLARNEPLRLVTA
jgi:hypothetical protein